MEKLMMETVPAQNGAARISQLGSSNSPGGKEQKLNLLAFLDQFFLLHFTGFLTILAPILGRVTFSMLLGPINSSTFILFVSGTV